MYPFVDRVFYMSNFVTVTNENKKGPDEVKLAAKVSRTTEDRARTRPRGAQPPAPSARRPPSHPSASAPGGIC